MSLSPLATAFLDSYSKGIPVGSKQKLFSGMIDQMIYDKITEEIGYGEFEKGFYLLLTDENEKLNQCLELWQFLLPDDGVTRNVIGKNAYGALLVAENAASDGTAAVIGILDPLTVQYWRDEHCLFTNFFGHWFPQKKVPHSFTDTSVFREMCEATDFQLSSDQLLAVKVPLTLEGRMHRSNFQVENIYSYYRTTASVYNQQLR